MSAAATIGARVTRTCSCEQPDPVKIVVKRRLPDGSIRQGERTYCFICDGLISPPAEPEPFNYLMQADGHRS